MDQQPYAGKPKEMAKITQYQRRQKLMDAFEGYQLEVKGAQQALNYDQQWVKESLIVVKSDLTKAQAALENFLKNQRLSVMLESNLTTQRTPERG